MAKQKKRSNPIITAFVFGIFGIVLIFQGVRTMAGLSGDILNITTCDQSEVQPGKYVEGDITYGYGCYIEKTTTYNHILTKTSGYYYLVDICDQNEDGSPRDSAKWIGISIKKGQKDQFDDISINDDAPPIHITGKIKKNSSKIQGFLDDYITDYVDSYSSYYGYTPTAQDYEYAKSEAFPYYIEYVDKSDAAFNLIMGGIFFLIAVIMILFAVRSSRNARQTASPAFTSYNGTGDFNGIDHYSEGYMANTATNEQPAYTDPFYRSVSDSKADESQGISDGTSTESTSGFRLKDFD